VLLARGEIRFNETLGFDGGGTMWDGKYIALSDQQFNSQKETVIYRVTLSGSKLTEVGKTLLGDTSFEHEADVLQPFVVGDKNTPVNRKRRQNRHRRQLGLLRQHGGSRLLALPQGWRPAQVINEPQASYGQSVSIAP
jgi:hypothetical protein